MLNLRQAETLQLTEIRRRFNVTEINGNPPSFNPRNINKYYNSSII